MNYGVLWFKREVLVILVKGFLKISVTLFEIEIDCFWRSRFFIFGWGQDKDKTLFLKDQVTFYF